MQRFQRLSEIILICLQNNYARNWISKRMSKDLTRNSDDFNGFRKDSGNFELISQGFEKEFNRFPQDSERTCKEFK